ncbi:MAG: efflux RND transporter permease subunit [SAR202 cluster bacterium]|nr:efflux RND transporter permease subunit [SAR202 cluster bacterium]
MKLSNWNFEIANFLSKRPNLSIIFALILTLFFIFPMFVLAPTEQAGPNPPGEVYDLQKDIDEKFPTPVHYASFVVEAKNGDVLTKDVLSELDQNVLLLLEKDEIGELAANTLDVQPYLFSYYDFDLGQNINGVASILGPIKLILEQMGTNLSSASNDQVKFAVSQMMSNENFKEVWDFLASQTSSSKKIVMGQEIDYWTSPAMTLAVMADNKKLGGGGLDLGLGGGEDIVNKEYLNRNFGAVIAGNEENFSLLGIANDVNLEAEEQGQTAGPYIMLTVIAAVLVVGASSGSYWVTAVTGIGIGIMMVWLKGVSALIGLKMGLVIDLIVPISMVALGVDFVVHAIRRYKEELNDGNFPRDALRIGYAGVVGALLLAMASDSIAFLSNLSSNIEAVIHFGAAAGIAVLSSYFILGVIAPVVVMQMDQLILKTGQAFQSRFWNTFRVLGSFLVAISSGAAVIMLVALDKTLGLLLLSGCLVAFVIIPILFMLRFAKHNKNSFIQLEPPAVISDSKLMKVTQSIVSISSQRSILVLIIATFVTILATYYAVQLRPSFDVKDFFDSNSEFVLGLDKFDEYMGEQGGEPGIAYVRGDLTDPSALNEIYMFIENLRDVEFVAVTPSGEVTFGPHVINMIQSVMGSPVAKDLISKSERIQISDLNNDGFPDSADQVRSIYDYALINGVMGEGGQLIASPDQVNASIYYRENEESLTAISFQIPGTRDQKIVTKTKELVDPLLNDLQSHPSISRAALTGSPFTRDVQLQASANTLFTALPIAIIAAIILLVVTMKSFKYAIVTVIPVGLVAAWLYGIMYVFGFSLNFVTAMIGAISIGVGIDYSIHMTQRFREEIRRNPTRLSAIKRAARGTGVALVASAVSSIAGFVILGFAPMPMFAAYGQLTAAMILFALLASLIVLPSLLMVITKEINDPVDI